MCMGGGDRVELEWEKDEDVAEGIGCSVGSQAGEGAKDRDTEGALACVA